MVGTVIITTMIIKSSFSSSSVNEHVLLLLFCCETKSSRIIGCINHKVYILTNGNDRLLQSPVLVFHIGKQKTPMTIHRGALIARRSTPWPSGTGSADLLLLSSRKLSVVLRKMWTRKLSRSLWNIFTLGITPHDLRWRCFGTKRNSQWQ